MLKLENVISDIKLHDQKIAAKSLNKDGEVIVKGIILSKPFKLQITVVSKIKGKKTKRVKNVEYSTTLKAAVADAMVKRDKWRDEMKTEAPKQAKAVTQMLTLSEAYKLYTAAQIIKFEARGKVYDDYRYQKLFDKHVRPSLGNVKLDNIDAEDLEAITNKMMVRRAKLDKKGNKIPLLDEDGVHLRYPNNVLKYVMETRPASERTKRTIYQLINPVYTYINGSNKIKLNVSSPAAMRDMPPLENEKTVEVGIDAFTELYNYEHPYYRDIFVWLMHGRRFGEVASLQYDDIDLDAGEYTIKKENNKARVDMTYKLTQWQRDTIDADGEGLVFPSINSKLKKINSSTLQVHFSLPCTLHDLRHIIGGALINKGVSIEIVGRILGHKPSRNVITNRYAKVSAEAADEALCEVLSEVLV